MPGKNDDDQQFGDDEEQNDEPTDETEETEGSDSGSEGSSDEALKSSKTDKRISDLQSRADVAEARANKAEAALKAGRQGESGGDPATKALMQELREASLDAVYGEFPQLRDYGIDRALIEGTTRAELRENAASLVGLIKSVESKVKNKVLADNGLSAEGSGTRVSKPVDYASMSDEDFEKVLASVG